jgi:RHH-type transcriptional regulator, rel operon repressor / antitoxin RelB
MRYMYRMALSVRLPEEIETRLEALAQKTGRTKTFYIREAVLEHLEDLEDYYLALERIQNPEGEPVSLADVIARLGFDDSI